MFLFKYLKKKKLLFVEEALISSQGGRGKCWRREKRVSLFPFFIGKGNIIEAITPNSSSITYYVVKMFIAWNRPIETMPAFAKNVT